MRIRGRVGKVLILTGVALAAAGVTVAAQAATQSAPAIHACVANSSGAVRIVKSGTHCKKSESATQWNRTGPTGPQGPRGPQGDQGNQGPQGPAGAAGTAGSMSFSLNGEVDMQPANTYQQVNYKHLAAGDYAVEATVNIQSDSGKFDGDTYADLSCYLNNGNNSFGDATARVYQPSGQVTGASLAMNGGVQFDAGGGNVTVLCKAQAGGEVLNSQVMFIKTAGYF
ncbi:hypothetical protein [Jatrophihabitans endophyticus]|uniref:hypothetical protein n=1 Tax=Jatrophihabitans endophyticus TaxID=1206085 RepID=UPI0026F2EA58|nr:hypothetical protein [Jatrophihabitans endophyticus]